MRQQYHFRSISSNTPDKVADIHIWDVNKLLKEAKSLNILTIDLALITELDQNYWYELSNQQPTCRDIVEHMKLIEAADLTYPILLCNQGKVIDGMHRVCKALMTGASTIKAQQFSHYIAPDYINVDPNKLSYDD